MSDTKLKQRLYPSRIDLPENTRDKVASILNATLATTLDLKTQAKQAHWNVKGMQFYQLHELFDTEQGGELDSPVFLNRGGKATPADLSAYYIQVLLRYSYDYTGIQSPREKESISGY